MAKKQIFKHSFTTKEAPKVQSVDQSLKDAVKQHQQGNLQRAGMLYSKILEMHPDHPDALNLMGVVQSQSGYHETAEQMITKAISINSNNPEYYNLGMMRILLIKYDCSPPPATPGWLTIICSTNVLPDRGIPTINRGRVDSTEI